MLLEKYLQLQESIAAVIAAENMFKKEAVLAWDGEKRPITKYYYNYSVVSYTRHIAGTHHWNNLTMESKFLPGDIDDTVTMVTLIHFVSVDGSAVNVTWLLIYGSTSLMVPYCVDDDILMVNYI